MKKLKKILSRSLVGIWLFAVVVLLFFNLRLYSTSPLPQSNDDIPAMFAQIYGDQSLANAVAQTGETVGLPWTSQGRKRYVGGMLPIGNIIVAYSQVARPWFSSREHHPRTEYAVSALWRWKTHAISMTIFLPALLRASPKKKTKEKPRKNPSSL